MQTSATPNTCEIPDEPAFVQLIERDFNRMSDDELNSHIVSLRALRTTAATKRAAVSNDKVPAPSAINAAAAKFLK